MSQINDVLMKDSNLSSNLIKVSSHKECDHSSLVKNRSIQTKALDFDKQQINQKIKINDSLLTVMDKDINRNQNQGNTSKLILIQNRRKKPYISKDNNYMMNQSHSRIIQIQKQKQLLVKQLRQLNESIAQINGETKKQIKQRMLMENIALNKAQQTVKKFKHQKARQQKRKRQILQVSLHLLKQQNQIIKKEREADETKRKQQKIKDIEDRLILQKQKRQERQLIQKQSNRLIIKLKRQDDRVKKKQNFQIKDIQIPPHRQTISMKHAIDIKKIEEHERKYLQDKEQQQKRVITISHPIRKYEKNIWAHKLQNETQNQNQLIKQKQQLKKQLFEKKLKYSQIVKSMYSPVRVKTSACEFTTPNENSQSRKALTKLVISSRRMSEGKSVGQFAKLYQGTRKHKQNGRLKNQQTIQQSSEQKQRRLSKQYEIRRETKQRLIKFQNRSVYWITAPHSNPKPKSKPHNYLGEMKKRNKSNIESMYKVLQDSQITQQEKYNKMIKMTTEMEYKAKLIEEVLKEGDQTATNLYIGSIHAKIALLQQI